MVRINLLRKCVHLGGLPIFGRVARVIVPILELRSDLLIARTLLFVGVVLILGGGVVVRLFGIGVIIIVVIGTRARLFVLGNYDTLRLIA